MKTKILLIDDHQLFIDGLSSMLSTAIGADVVATTCPNEALSLVKESTFDLVLIDIKMPNINGLELLILLKKVVPSIPCGIVSGEFNPETIFTAIQHGAIGYIPKEYPNQQFLNALDYILKGKQYLPENYKKRIQQVERVKAKNGYQINHKILTPRQLEVLHLISNGSSNKEIAKILNISPGTVKTHLKAIFLLLGSTNRAHCIMRAIEWGLIKPPSY